MGSTHTWHSSVQYSWGQKCLCKTLRSTMGEGEGEREGMPVFGTVKHSGGKEVLPCIDQLKWMVCSYGVKLQGGIWPILM